MQNSIDILIIGAANPTIIRTIEDINTVNIGTINIIGILDNFRATGSRVLGVEVIGRFSEISRFSSDIYFVNTVASTCAIRRETTQYFLERGYKSINIVHPSVNMNHVRIGEGNIVFEGAMLHPCVELGSYNIVSSKACIAHDTHIKDYNFIGPNSYICGHVSMGSENFFGVSCSVGPRKRIGDRCTIYAGSFLNNSLASDVKAKGTPAKEF